jgi:hypothetical protein
VRPYLQLVLPLLLVALAPLPLAAQSSEFGTRGLGLPGRAQSVRALGSGGSLGLFDSGSSENPAALADAFVLTATFTGMENFRNSTGPSGTLSGRDMRFPQITVAGPVGHRPFGVGVSYSNYTDRDFSVATSSALELRGTPVTSFDTLTSRGGLNDLRLGVAYRGPSAWNFGLAFHLITGSARTEIRRAFSDTSYAPVFQSAEISYAGVGVSAGLLHTMGRLTIAATARTDGNANVDRDSTRVNRVGLPVSFGGGIRYRAGARLDLAAQGMYHGWSAADAALVAGGGTGARNTVAISAGGEYVTDLRRPYRRPIRFGARFAQLPFPVVSGGRPREFGASLGTGTRFLDPRTRREVAGLDLSLEHVWRREGTGYREGAWLVSVGVTIKP